MSEIKNEILAGAMFRKLLATDLTGKIEKKSNGTKELSYLSWAHGWAEFCRHYPTATYKIHTWNDVPYLYDPNLGYMCMTSITAGGLTRTMWLPVMNGANKAMKAEPYTYQVKNWQTKQYEEKTVEAATMFDINSTIMRCLVKNMGMFGLGLSLYVGEDIPDSIVKEDKTELPKVILDQIAQCKTRDEVEDIYLKNKAGKQMQALVAACSARIAEIEGENKGEAVEA